MRNRPAGEDGDELVGRSRPHMTFRGEDDKIDPMKFNPLGLSRRCQLHSRYEVLGVDSGRCASCSRFLRKIRRTACLGGTSRNVTGEDFYDRRF